MSETVYVTFHDNINSQSANRIITTCTQIIQQFTPKTLYFVFSSGGGSVDSGVAVYNYLRGLPCKVVMHNVGSIDSIANAIFLAGTERYSAPNAAFLLHGVSWGFGQGANLSYAQMKETLSRFDAAEQLFAGIMEERTSFTSKEVRKLFRQGQSKDPSYALSKGIIHEIRNLDIIPGCQVISIPPG